MAGSLVAQLLQCLTPGRVVAGVTVFFVSSLFLDYAWKPRYPASIPSVGHGTGLVNAVRNFFGYVMHYREWVLEGYVKYTKQDRSFIVPSAASRPPDIILPRSQIAWMLEQPDNVLSTHQAHNAVLYSEYNFLGKRFSDDVWHTKVIHKSLARHIAGLIPAVQDEVEAAVDACFGGTAADVGEWKKVNVWQGWLQIVPPITNRMLVGEKLCREPRLLRSYVAFTDAVVRNCFLLAVVPKILHPIAGRLVALPNWWHWRRSARYTVPVIRQRLHDMAHKAAGDPAYETWSPPEDFITWDIRLASAEANMFELDPYVISKRLLPIEFAAIHTTVLTGMNLLLDVFSSDPSRGFLEGLREEAERVFKEENGRWTKDGLSRLYRIDSAIRESMRLSNFAVTLVERMVIAPEGLTNQAEGWHVPKGSFVTLNLEGIHRDGDLFQDPQDYDAFRYSRPREEFERTGGSGEEALRLKKLGMVTTSDQHLAFSHGRHACPGRFFVAHELKMIVAHLLLNYDVKPLAERPQPQWMGSTIIPPLDACIEVRRRKSTV